MSLFDSVWIASYLEVLDIRTERSFMNIVPSFRPGAPGTRCQLSQIIIYLNPLGFHTLKADLCIIVNHGKKKEAIYQT